ncbi:ARPP-1 family domain-containing protein [Haloferula sp.]|uniref:ARPP-1 family domain-containing protein n=1 Tax=Haloferula sp. TaxID=2497595 RepID=UPI003C70F97A
MSENSSPIHPAIRSLLDSVRLGEPRIHGGIGLWPVIATPRPEPAYITLVDAQAHELFSITEVSEGGSVPNLRVVNGTPHHIMLFDGEELKGAKQNRILNTTILIEAGTQLDVPVSCTEQGRWSYESHVFSPSGNVAYSQLRKSKSRAVSDSLEAKQGHASNQGQVWEEIAIRLTEL